MDPLVYLPFLTAALGAAATYLIARRKASGRIETTDAEQLWQEQSDFRTQMREELERRVTECKNEVRSIQRQNLELRVENHELIADNMRLQFLTHPEIPQDVKDDFIDRQRLHVIKVKAALDEAKRLEEKR